MRWDSYAKVFFSKIKFKFLRRMLKIDRSTFLLPGFAVHGNVTKLSKFRIGKSSILSCALYFERFGFGKITIGDRCHIGGNTKLISIDGIEIGDDVTIAWDCTIYDHDSHPLDWEQRKFDTLKEAEDLRRTGNPITSKDWSHVRSRPIVIENKAWLGFGVTVLKGVRIGEGAVVGAMSVVTKDVPPYAIVAGNPARIVRINPPAKEMMR